jgi:hypothetical protein
MYPSARLMRSMSNRVYSQASTCGADRQNVSIKCSKLTCAGIVTRIPIPLFRCVPSGGKKPRGLLAAIDTNVILEHERKNETNHFRILCSTVRTLATHEKNPPCSSRAFFPVWSGYGSSFSALQSRIRQLIIVSPREERPIVQTSATSSVLRPLSAPPR